MQFNWNSLEKTFLPHKMGSVCIAIGHFYHGKLLHPVRAISSLQDDKLSFFIVLSHLSSNIEKSCTNNRAVFGVLYGEALFSSKGRPCGSENLGC